MSSVGFSIKSDFSLEDFHRNINRALSEGKFKRWLQESAEVAYKKAYELCPIDTGWMQGQLVIEVTGDTASLECLCEYASYHEYGWVRKRVGGTDTNPKKYMGGYRPFMRPGIIAGEKYFEKQLEKWVNKYLKYGK
jgi:phage gpG-like protein